MNDYVCPKCRGFLSIENEIIFLTKNNQGQSAIVLLSAELGNYGFRKNPLVDFEEGDHVNFICPICYENLDAKEIDDNLASIIKIEEDKSETNIVFSSVLGEKCTYSVRQNGVEAYGEHKDTYLNKL